MELTGPEKTDTPWKVSAPSIKISDLHIVVIAGVTQHISQRHWGLHGHIASYALWVLL